MSLKEFILKVLRAFYTIIFKNSWRTEKYISYKDQKANDFIRKSIESNTNGLLITKFGTVELQTLLYFLRKNDNFEAYKDFIKGRREIFENTVLDELYTRAGFFPKEKDLYKKFTSLYVEDIKEIDILGSYVWTEKYMQEYLPKNYVGTNLEGFYAPFLWQNPWTKALKGKKVLVIHPFTESIKKQYQKREFLFSNNEVLPEFKELILVKAVQTIAGTQNNDFETWFDALDFMKNEISSKDFDIALIGCGAYGLPLAAHVKRMGKIAIQLAGWTQMLFGIYGNRWIEDQKEYAHFVNEHWTRPNETEKPKHSAIVENGCYW